MKHQAIPWFSLSRRLLMLDACNFCGFSLARVVLPVTATIDKPTDPSSPPHKTTLRL